MLDFLSAGTGGFLEWLSGHLRHPWRNGRTRALHGCASAPLGLPSDRTALALRTSPFDRCQSFPNWPRPADNGPPARARCATPRPLASPRSHGGYKGFWSYLIRHTC